MKISKEKLEELRQIIKKDFNVDLNDQELHETAYTLLQCAHEEKISTGK